MAITFGIFAQTVLRLHTKLHLKNSVMKGWKVIHLHKKKRKKDYLRQSIKNLLTSYLLAFLPLKAKLYFHIVTKFWEKSVHSWTGNYSGGVPFHSYGSSSTNWHTCKKNEPRETKTRHGSKGENSEIPENTGMSMGIPSLPPHPNFFFFFFWNLGLIWCTVLHFGHYFPVSFHWFIGVTFRFTNSKTV